jgi:putative ABC transport system permease protein
VVRALDRKLLRDLVHLRGQMLAIAVVVACGVAIVVSSRIGYESLARSRSSYYAAYRFADVFCQLKRAPDSLASRIAAIPGVAALQTRVAFDVTLDVPGLAEPATGRLLSVPEQGLPALNDVHIRRGRRIEPGRRDEVIVSEAFAQANDLEVGDSLGAILNGRWEELRIVGVGLSPEYVYELRGTSVFPDNKRFGVLWMSRDAMGPAFDMDGAFNDVSLSLTRDASEAEVVARLDRLLAPYGGLGAYGREDQVSHRFLSDEIRQNRVFGVVLPLVFLGVAAFLLNVVLSRLVATQRDQIGVLKAFGYGHVSIAAHYLEFALVAILIGGAGGIGLGVWIGRLINRMYVNFYRFPVLKYEVRGEVIALALGASAAAALIGALAAVRRAFALPPAEAMRPERPASFHAGLIERLGAHRLLSPELRMIVRSLTRRPARFALSVLGIAFAVALLVFGRFFADAIVHIANVQFRLVQREDVTVTALDPLPAAARHALARLPAVMRSEAFRVVPVRMRYGHRYRRTALMGLEPETEMRRLIDRDNRSVSIPPQGVVLTSKLAEVLGVSVGDSVTVEVLEGARPTRMVPVSGLVDELIGLSAYMNVDALNRLMREGATVSGSFLAVDERRRAELYAELKRMPAVGGVAVRTAELESFEKTLGESLGIFTTIMVTFACVIAVAVVYNAARIALSERGRELASLRVLGFTRREVASILLGEQALVTVAAIPLGYGIGYGICAIMARVYQWELFRLPLIVSNDTYVFALAVVAGASLFSALLVARRIRHLDLIEVLKTRE